MDVLERVTSWGMPDSRRGFALLSRQGYILCLRRLLDNRIYINHRPAAPNDY
jgi:hypothetical protein